MTQETPGLPDRKAMWATLDPQGQLARLAARELQDLLDRLDRLGQKVMLEMQDPLDPPALQVQRATQAMLDLPERQALLDLQERMAQLGRRVPPGPPARPAP